MKLFVFAQGLRALVRVLFKKTMTIKNTYQKDANLSSEEHKCVANDLKADFI